MNDTFKTKTTLKNKSSDGFIILGTALAIFLILSLFSIYLLRIVVNENVMSSFALLDIRTRNLSHSGLEHGIQLFKDNGSPYISPIEKNFNPSLFIAKILTDNSKIEISDKSTFSRFILLSFNSSNSFSILKCFFLVSISYLYKFSN